MTASKEGYAAYKSRVIFSSNPYPPRSLENMEWSRGWLAALAGDRD